MKEYKLIKKYPSLPINWEEGMLVGQGDRQNGTYTPCNGKYEDEGRPFCLPLSEVWDNPEFWEEVVEKDYEILSIIGTNKHPLPKTILYLKDVYKKDFTGHLNDESNCWQIHSVKRLSDGEVFTIGDTIKHNTEIIDVITRITLINNYIYLSGKNNPSEGAFSIKLIKHYMPLSIKHRLTELIKSRIFWKNN